LRLFGGFLPGTVDKPENRSTESLGPRFSTLVDALLAFGISVALLIPCFWTEHMQAGDLGSHVYNAWLVTQIKSGTVQGLGIATQWTNVLFDWTLEALLGKIGLNWAERVVPGVAVLIFFWGALSFINITSGRRSWLFAPTLGMLAFGLVFQVGFMNFYLSTGLTLWVMVLLWQPTKRRALIALPIAVLALVAHAAPLAWAAVVLTYIHIARRLSPTRRRLLLLAGVAFLALLRVIIMRNYPAAWSLSEVVSLVGLSGLVGVEQVWLYGMKYLIVAAGVFIVWGVLFLERVDQGGVSDDPLAQVWFLQTFNFIILPMTIQLQSYPFIFSYISQRLSLFGALLLCAVVGKARYGRGITRFSALVATVFFTFLYLDHRALNLAENEIADLVQTLPPGQRVVAALEDSNSRLHSLAHILDRRCVEHCFSYGNYEPVTGQFRVRVLAPNQVEAPNIDVLDEIQNGRHIVTAAEAPLYCICPCEDKTQRFCIRALAAGERTCAFSVPVSPEF
jgi:hypothetical protein